MSNHPLMTPFMHPAGAMQPQPGYRMPHHHSAHGFCTSCCHPVAKCVCHHRDCRKIEKELLVQPTTVVGGKPPGTGASAPDLTTEASLFKVKAMMDLTSPMESEEAAKKGSEVADGSKILRLRQQVVSRAVPVGMESTVIGGGCCVHLSLEYMPLTPIMDLPAFSAVMVIDSESTIMFWGKFFTGDGYHVKECVISTNPGTYLWVASISSVTRARWCEIISC